MVAFGLNESTDDFDSEVALGLRGIQVRRVAGLGNVVIATTGATAVDIWTGAGTYQFMSAATALEVFSTNAADAIAGTGARTVTVQGLDNNFNEVVQTVSLNGAAVALPTPLRRINQALITGAGSGLVNAGQINVRDVSGGTIRAIIPAGLGITQQSQFTVPAGHTLLVKSVELEINSSAGGGGASKGADASFYFGSPVATNPFFRLTRKMSCTDIQPYALIAETTIAVQEKNDFQLRCSYTSAACTLTGAWEGHLFRRID